MSPSSDSLSSMQAGVLAGNLQDYWDRTHVDPNSHGGGKESGPSSAAQSGGGGRATYDFDDPFEGAV
jgi:hypothetical protein